jgi:hypothetical protein
MWWMRIIRVPAHGPPTHPWFARNSSMILVLWSFAPAARSPGFATIHSLSYSLWRRHHMPVSLRPSGARSSHWYMPHRPSSPRAYAE